MEKCANTDEEYDNGTDLEFLVKMPRHTPRQIKELMWGFLNHLIALSNLDDKGIIFVMQMFHTTRLTLLQSIPKRYLRGQTGRDLMLWLDNAEGLVYTQVRRAKDAKERRFQCSQFREIKSHIETENGGTGFTGSGTPRIFHTNNKGGMY